MRRSTLLAIVITSTLGVLTACSDTRAPLSPTFGESVRHNMAAQVVNPDPEGADAGAPPMNGERAQDAHKRYRTGKVKEPQGQVTSSVGGSGGGASASQ